MYRPFGAPTESPFVVHVRETTVLSREPLTDSPRVPSPAFSPACVLDVNHCNCLYKNRTYATLVADDASTTWNVFWLALRHW